MAFVGDYGNMSAINAAREILSQIEQELGEEGITRLLRIDRKIEWCKEKYDVMRHVRMIEGMQRVVILNAGDLGFSRLPLFYDKHNDRQYAKGVVTTVL